MSKLNTGFEHRKTRLTALCLQLDRLKYNMPYGWVKRVTGWSIDKIKRRLVSVRKDLADALGMENKS